jgi:endonuclease-8
MPEGPEIRREADRIAAVLENRILERVYFGLPHLRRYATTLEEQRVERVTTRGKAMLVRFDGGLTLFSHNQLYGKWMVRERGQMPSTRRSLRVGLHTATHSAFLYSASNIDLLDEAALAVHPFLSRLGPDVLDDSLGWRDMKARLKSPEFCRRSFAALYLDQHFLAGIGNYLRSEILHAAALPPLARPIDLGEAALGRLSRQTLAISLRAYETGGVTNPPARVRRLKKAGETRRGYRFAVFARQHQPCYGCGSEVARITVSSRRLYLCPECQREVK